MESARFVKQVFVEILSGIMEKSIIRDVSERRK